MKASKPINPSKACEMKKLSECNKTPVKILLSLATATTCSALAVKVLKKGELALLMTLMAIPITLICLNRSSNTRGGKD